MVSEAPFGLAALRATADVLLFAPHLDENGKDSALGFIGLDWHLGPIVNPCTPYRVQSMSILLVHEDPDTIPFIEGTLSRVGSPRVDGGILLRSFPVPRRSRHDWLYACLCIVDFSPHSVEN